MPALKIGAAHIALAVIASEPILRGQAVEAVHTLVTESRLWHAHIGLTGTLPIDYVAHTHMADGARTVAVAVFAALWIPALKVPVERFASVTDASRHLLFACAECARGHHLTATQLKEISRHTFRVAVALLAKGVVVSRKQKQSNATYWVVLSMEFIWN